MATIHNLVKYLQNAGQGHKNSRPKGRLSYLLPLNILLLNHIEPMRIIIHIALLHRVGGVVVVAKLLILDAYLSTCGYALGDECVTAYDDISADNGIAA